MNGSLRSHDGGFRVWTGLGFSGIDAIYRGKEGWRRFIGTWHEAPWADITVRVERIEDLDDRVVALLTFEAEVERAGSISRSSGSSGDRWRGTKVSKLVSIASWDEALGSREAVTPTLTLRDTAQAMSRENMEVVRLLRSVRRLEPRPCGSSIPQLELMDPEIQVDDLAGGLLEGTYRVHASISELGILLGRFRRTIT